MIRAQSVAFFVLITLVAAVSPAAEPVDLDAVTKIREQGFRHSQVMDLAWHLTEGVGPRLTGSPQELQAHEWAAKKFEEWGLETRLDEYQFGRSWMVERVQARMLAPYIQPLEVMPEAWSPGTDGVVSGRVVLATLKTDEDLEKWAGKLEGAIILTDEATEMKQIEADLFRRYDEQRLAELERYDIPAERRSRWRQRMLKRFQFWKKLASFYQEQGVLATIEPSSRDNGIVRVTGNSSNRETETPLGVTALSMTTEHYNRLVRMLDRGLEPELEIDVAVRWFEDDDRAYNTIADFKGTDLADELVIVGGHLDSWHTGTGATDNGGSCAVVMEAIRLIKDSGLKPRRTIRAAFWSGEEQGLLGSRDYVKRYVATRPEPTDPEQLALPTWARERTWPIQPLPGHKTTSAYFNTDYGTGRVRGLYAQENAAVAAIFEAWLAPFADLDANHVTMENAGGTDHLAFDAVGVPGFQFIQDGMDYMGRTHHSNVDTYDHLHADDLKQSAVVIAAVIWHAANRDEMLPRKPMPTKPKEDKPKEKPASQPAAEAAKAGAGSN
ncbi:MAG: M20/M25/M40 family metallo-hydrolase [Holophagae bacterium]|jgi:hypothetical protein